MELESLSDSADKLFCFKQFVDQTRQKQLQAKPEPSTIRPVGEAAAPAALLGQPVQNRAATATDCVRRQQPPADCCREAATKA